jgi:hypothetical protein
VTTQSILSDDKILKIVSLPYLSIATNRPSLTALLTEFVANLEVVMLQQSSDYDCQKID